MIDEAIVILEYVPIEFGNKEHEVYVQKLWESFTTNYDGKIYQFAYLAIHMLYMTVIYSMLLKVKLWKPDEFDYALIGINSNARNKIFRAENTFCFCELKESIVVEFLRLINFDYSEIGEFKRSVQIRNNIAHPNGLMPIFDQSGIDIEIEKLLGYIHKIQLRFPEIINNLFIDLLEKNWNADNFQYDNYKDEINEIIFPYYGFSNKDLEIIKKFDISLLENNSSFAEIQVLFEEIISLYGVNVE